MLVLPRSEHCVCHVQATDPLAWLFWPKRVIKMLPCPSVESSCFRHKHHLC